MKSDPSRWGVTSLQLQRPEHVYFDGAIRPWEDAVFHVSTEAVTRGLNVFEGLKGYWQADDGFAWRTLRRHYERLRRSARLLAIPVDFPFEHFRDAVFELTRVELREGADFYVRATLFVVEGHYGEGTSADLVLTGYQQTMDPPSAVRAGTSTWRRAPDLSMPHRAKTSANYLIARLARLEGKSREYEEMLLLNQSGRVAEGIGACLVMVRDGRMFSPPSTEGALESITLEIFEALAEEEGMEIVRRPIDRSELYVADEIGLVGTLAELTLLRGVDEIELPEEAPLLSGLHARYREALRGKRPHPAVEVDVLPR